MKEDYGLLLNTDIKIQRKQFKEMVSLLGVYVQYEAPVNKQYTLSGEVKSQFKEPIKVGCIFNENIDQKTAHVLGWDHELTERAAIIHVPYDLEDLQIGALFTVPSAFDNTPGRKFRVTKLSAIQIYPASIACEIVPEFENTMAQSETTMFANSNFNLLYEGDSDRVAQDM